MTTFEIVAIVVGAFALIVIGYMTRFVVCRAKEAVEAAERAAAASQQVLHEVKTMNELTIGQLGEAEETRRIESKPPAERTSREKRHVDAANERSTGA